MRRLTTFGLGAIFLAACGSGETERSEAEEPASAPDIAIALESSPASWRVDRDASSVRFRATQNGKAFEGGFGRWNASIVMDPMNPEEEGSIEARIDLASADAGTGERNKALPGEDWFHTALHPVAVYRSDAIEGTGEGAYVAEGTLSIRGVSEDVSMPFSLDIDEAGRAVADGSVMLDRSQFGVGQGEFANDKWVGFEVEVLLHIEAEPEA